MGPARDAGSVDAAPEGVKAAGWQNRSMAGSGGTPLVSVIVRTKDRPLFLAEALESLRRQTFRDFETVVVNDSDAPLDGSLFSDPPGSGVRVVSSGPPHGRARALNSGVGAARGCLVAYLDDDDLYLPDHLEALTAVLTGDGAPRAAYTDADLVLQTRGEDGGWRDGERRPVFGRDFEPARLPFANSVPLVCLAHERQLWEAAGRYDESFDLYEDWEFLVRLSRVAPLVRVHRTTALYRVRDDGSNATASAPWGGPRSQAARLALYRKHWPLHTPEAEMTLIDGFERDLTASLAREREARSAFDALRPEAERLAAEVERLRPAGEEADRLRGELERHRSEASAREAALAAGRDAAIADREAFRRHRDELQETVQRMTDSLAWRLFTPYWRLKAWLGRGG